MYIKNNTKYSKEVNKHGSDMLPYEIYRTSMPRFFRSFPMHWHDEIEIIYVINGRAVYTVDFEEYIIEEGDILFIPPASLHSFAQYENEEFDAATVIFSMNMVNNSQMDICSIKYIMPIFNNEVYLGPIIRSGTPEATELAEYIKKVAYEHINKQTGYELRVRIGFLDIIQYCYLHTLYTGEKKISTMKRSAEQIKNVINYIEEHYMDRITLEELAQFANLSVYHLSHLFKKCTGQSTNEYINNYRLTKAAGRLLEDNSAVLNIAIDCGYNNISYFNRAFKNKYGMTPGEYRRSKRIGE